MLTIKEIIQLYRHGLEVRLRRKKHPKSLKGYYDPSHFEINIFLPDLVSEFDFGVTLLHEFVHARDDRKSGQDDSDESGERVEAEARETHDKRSYILELIKELYNIGSLKDYANRINSSRPKV
jgi:hypothetical protein